MEYSEDMFVILCVLLHGQKQTARYKVFAVFNSFCFHVKNNLRFGDDICIMRFVLAAMVLQIKSPVM